MLKWAGGVEGREMLNGWEMWRMLRWSGDVWNLRGEGRSGEV